MKKILVFGSSGFSGHNFCRYISQFSNSYLIYGFDRYSNSNMYLCKYLQGDAYQGNVITNALREVEPDYIINLIGTFSAPTFNEYMQTNVSITNSILEAIIKEGLKPKKVLLIGSAAEYGCPKNNPVLEEDEAKPLSYYGISKYYQTILGKYYFEKYNLPVSIARTFNILGSGLSTKLSIGSFADQIMLAKDGDAIKVGNLESQRDFLNIDDVVRLYWEIILKGKPGEIYNVCSGKPRSMRDVLVEMIKNSGKSLSIETDPKRIKADDIAVIFGSNDKVMGIA